MSYYAFDNPHGSAGMGRYFGYDDPQAAANGLGAYFTQQAPVLPMCGLGQDETNGEMDTGSLAAFGVLWILVRAAGGYVVGRALAPAPGDKMSWGVVGSLVGAAGGPVGLGLMAVLSLEAKN
jgi:hypothetical protein